MNNAILIVEDELITANGIADLLTDEGFPIAGMAVDAQAALSFFDTGKEYPGIAICDINIQGDVDGITLAKQLKEHNCEVVFLTAYSDNTTLYKAFGTDPVMYIVKPFTDKQLLTAVHMAFHRLMKKQDKGETKTELLLTKREKEIAALVMRGFTSKQIAAQLFISLETVKTHRKSMLQKNNIHNFSQLIHLLYQ